MRTKSVHFYAQCLVTNEMAGIVSFQKVLLNIGGGMDLSTGFFTAPVKGIYHFQFNALKSHAYFSESIVHLVVNGKQVSQSYAESRNAYTPHSGIGASLQLNAGDKVGLEKTFGGFEDYVKRYTHFTGWLVEEYIQVA